MKYYPFLLSAIIVTILSTSCANVKNFQYLQGSFDTARLSKVQFPQPLIQKGDLLGITVYSDDPQATAAVTRQNGGNALPVSMSGDGKVGSSSASAPTGFLVDPKGDLQFNKLPAIHVEGLTKEQLADTLEYFYTQMDLLKNPYVEVRFLNYKITVVGEVNSPGSYAVPADKVTAFEAVGLAGDITVSGRRDNVLVVRETNGVRSFGRINLQDPNVLLSPYYYLQQNDLVIVDVGKLKASANNQTTFQYISLGATLLSIAAVFISIFSR